MSYLYKSNSILKAYTDDPADEPGIVKFQMDGADMLYYPVIFTNYNLQKNEKIQVTESFGEYIHIYAFGKSADTLQMSGHILADSELNKSLRNSGQIILDKYINDFRAFELAQKGKLLTVAGPGDIVFTGVCVSINISANAQFTNLLEFSMNLVSVDSSLAYENSSTSSQQSESRSQVTGTIA